MFSLIRQTRLKLGESLPSLSARLTKLNHYDTPSILSYLCLKGLDRDKLDCPSMAATYGRISELTRIAPDELYRATAHRFARTLTPPDRKMGFIELLQEQKLPLLREGIASKQLRPQNSAQYCPECLKESPYHRLAWLPVAVSACLRHNCLLLAQCPDCGEPVNIQAVVESRCNHCEFDLTQAQVISVKSDGFGMHTQQVIGAWLGLVSMPSDSMSLPRRSPSVLFRVLEGLRWAALVAGPDWKYAHRMPCQSRGDESERTRLSPLESYRAYATAFKGIVNWPEDFFGFLQAYPSRESDEPNGGLQADLGTLYSCWLERYWRHTAFRFVQSAFDQYLTERCTVAPGATRLRRCRERSALVDKFTFVNVSQAAHLLSVSPGTVNKLVDTGQLTAYKPEGMSSTRRYRFFRRADILALCVKWQNSASLAEVADRLGVSEAIAVDLVKAGILEAERGPAVDGSAQWLLTSQAVEGFLKQIAENCQVCESSNELIDLITAAKKLAVVGSNAAGVLARVADGRLHGWWPSESSTEVGSLWFRELDIEACVEAVLAENGWLRREDVARRMGVKVGVVSRWIASDLLEPATVCGTAHYFDRDDVERFTADHVFSDEAAEILGVGRLVVQRWARDGRLTPVAGPGVDECHRYLFRREEVERLRPANRLTAPQLAERLGISRSQMWQRIRQGKVKPVSGPGIDRCKHYLFLQREE